MKVLLVIFAIYVSYTLCEENKILEPFAKPYPKKYRAHANGMILLNAAKYEKAIVPPMARSYTAFQVVGGTNTKTVEGVPDSPYFPVDQGYAQRLKTKKTLLDYPWSILRNKRSAVLNESSVEKDGKKEEPKATEEKKVEETTPMPATTVKDNKEEPTVIKASSPKKVQEESESTIKIKPTKTTSATDNKDIERVGQKTAKKNGTARKGKSQSKSKAASKKNAGRVNRNSKSKSKVKNAAAGRAKLKGKQTRTAKKPKANRAANKKNKKRKGNRQRSKNQKAKPKNERAGKIPKDTRRLIAAREALIEDYPYVVSIQKDGHHWCSGALLNPRMVITTANCLWKANHISRMEVRAGSRHSNRGGQMAGIQEVVKHPGWGIRKNPDHDVAILLLDKRLRFTDSIHGVDLPNRVMLPPFDDAWITSWGAERRDGVYNHYDSTSLQVYHARLMDREKCNNVTTRFSVAVTENFICFTQSGRQAPCTRDTGAPAVSDGILWGLASWGIRKLCGTERFPAMFSYLASHSNMDFLVNTTRFLMSDKRQYPFLDRYPENRITKKN